MGLACDVYTKLMFHRGHGYPLWEPEPTKSGEVLVGDIGYILEGGFYRLFNATLPADHAIHERCGVPDGYVPFTYPDALRHRRESALQSGPICSRSIVALNVGASVGVSVGAPGVLGELRFKCADEQGAVLVLEQDGVREALHPCKDLVQYIACNHESWHRFAQDVFRLDLGESDILFVSGCIKTGAWALAAATHRAREGELVFGGTFGALSQATFSVAAKEQISMSIEHRSGPRPLAGGANGSKRDQCVFLHYYKCKRRRVLGPKVIRAASEEPSFDRSSSPDDPTGDLLPADASVVLESAPGRAQFSDPVDGLLAYILDNTDAECAVASDEDLHMFTQLDRESVSDNVHQALRALQPPLNLLEGSIGTLHTGDSGSSLTTIPEDPAVDPVGTLTTNFRFSFTPTPPHLRSQTRRTSPGLRRQRSFSSKRRSCTPTPVIMQTFGQDISASPSKPDKPRADEIVAADGSPYSTLSLKRLRGRPPGSKNKARAPELTAGDASTSASPKRLRGRPGKRKAEPEGAAGVLYSSTSEPRPKRKKGSARTSPQPPPAQMNLEERPSKRKKTL